jgi:hypothetical protein
MECFMSATSTRLLGALCISSSALIAGCQLPTGVQAGDSNVLVVPDPSPSPVGNNSSDPSSTVCNPLGGGETTGLDNGLYARLRYIPDANAPRPQDIADFFGPDGADAGMDLYFNQLYVPTRYFADGFQTQDGTLLETPQGTTLYEWFELTFNSTVKLSEADTAGLYQFAILSDDGSILSIDQGNGAGLQQFINNDGQTASRLACATSTIRFDNSTALPIKVDYFQGPRYNIALILLWREIPENACNQDIQASLSDPACGQVGNDEFFTWSETGDAPSDPTSVWLGMINRGWKVLNVENYYLPSTAPINPCATVTPTPTPTATATVSPSPSPSPSVTSTPSPSPTPSPTPSPSATCSGFGCGSVTGN